MAKKTEQNNLKSYPRASFLFETRRDQLLDVFTQKKCKKERGRQKKKANLVSIALEGGVCCMHTLTRNNTYELLCLLSAFFHFAFELTQGVLLLVCHPGCH